MRTVFINRHGLKISALLENQKGKGGLAFVAHGLSGDLTQPHIQQLAQVLVSLDYIVVRWDATHSLGMSEGELAEATLTGYFEDFEDVVTACSSLPWYTEPFVVVGHSLGGACCVLFALKYAQKVRAMVPLSAFLSGSISLASFGQKTLDSWEKMGYREELSSSRKGVTKRYNWSLAQDMRKYELINQAAKISTPTLLIVGTDDAITPASSQQQFFQNLTSTKKELHIIEEADHKFGNVHHRNQIASILRSWIRKID